MYEHTLLTAVELRYKGHHRGVSLMYALMAQE